MLNLEKGVTLCDRFELIERLGTGGQGEVWRAIDAERAGAEIALKVLHEEVARAPSAWETLRHEHEVTQRLGHPGIAEAGAPARDDEATVLPMTLATGDLRRLRGEPYTRIVPALISIAAAMEYAHSRGVIHRDLKPGNVLIGPEGQVMVSDFGVASLDGVLPINTIGSPFSASPQQLEGEPPNVADDIYGLGSLAYELLSGYPPYYPNFEPRVVIGQPVPELLPIHVAPPRLIRLVMRMLAKDPGDRPARMRDVEEDLHAVLHDTVSSGPEEEEPTAPTIGRDDVRRALGGELEPSPGGSDESAVASLAERRAVSDAANGAPAEQPERSGSATAVDGVVQDESAPFDPDASRGDSDAPTRERSSASALLKWLGLAALASALIGVFVLLPRLAEQRATDAAKVAPPGATGKGVGSAPGTAAPGGAPPNAIAAARAQQAAEQETRKRFAEGQAAYETALGSLEDRAAGVWGGAAFASAKSLGADAAAAMEAGNTEIALDRIKVARQRLDRLGAQAAEASASQVDAGDRALLAGQTDVARQAFELALRVDPASAAAKAGLKRVGGLASVLPTLTAAENALRARDLPRAIAGFEDVLRADPKNLSARDGLAIARTALGDDAFSKAMGEALDALRAERFDAARGALERARSLRPKAPEVSAGFAELASRSAGRDVTSVNTRAAELERAERWAEALGEYETLLQRDAGLEFARLGRERVRPRAELAAQLQGLIDKPERLAAVEVRADADRLLARARAVSSPGPVLRSQVARVQALLPAYDKPVRVALESDGQTQVVIQRVRALGAFEKTEVELKPGRYTLVGSRPGYRDVRREITVAPGAQPQTVALRCTEAIP